MRKIDIASIASNLEYNDGIWSSKQSSWFSYPEDGHGVCLQMEENSFWFKHRNNCILETMKLFPPGGTLLDIGGGNGYVSMGLAGNGMDSILLEPGIRGIENAQRRGLNRLICSTLQDAGFLDGSIPAAGLFDVIEHMEDDKGILRQIHKYLVPGGRLYVTVPAYNILWSQYDVLAGHYRRYTCSTLSDRLAEAGFRTEHATYFFWFLPLPVFLFRTLPDWLFRRKNISMDEVKDHPARSSLLNRLLDAEERAIGKGTRIPFGGSCLIVARKE